MRHPGWLAALLCLAACSGSLFGSSSPNSATLILKDPVWDRVNIEVVITRSSDCDNRGDGYVETRHYEMAKDHIQKIEAPNGENICWRHQRDPEHPVEGAWSGWSRATMFPGQEHETDL
jgi:hypothetical protein